MKTSGSLLNKWQYWIMVSSHIFRISYLHRNHVFNVLQERCAEKVTNFKNLLEDDLSEDVLDLVLWVLDKPFHITSVNTKVHHILSWLAKFFVYIASLFDYFNTIIHAYSMIHIHCTFKYMYVTKNDYTILKVQTQGKTTYSKKNILTLWFLLTWANDLIELIQVCHHFAKWCPLEVNILLLNSQIHIHFVVKKTSLNRNCIHLYLYICWTFQI